MTVTPPAYNWQAPKRADLKTANAYHYLKTSEVKKMMCQNLQNLLTLKEAREELESLKKYLSFFKFLKTEAIGRLSYWDSINDAEMCKRYKIDIKNHDKRIKEIKAQIKEVKLIYGI